MPRIMRACTFARPRSIAARIDLHGSRRARRTTASPIRKWPMLSSTISGSAAIVSARRVIEPVAGMHFEAEAAAQASRPSRMRCQFRLRGRRVARRPAHRTRRRCESRSPARRARAAASICAGSAAMNSDTRMPASRSSRDRRRELRRAGRRHRGRLRWCAPARRSGTRQAACGRVSIAIATISSVAAISKLSGLAISALSRAMSSSRMWRRSSRRCAVMPSAPASIASFAARTGSGCRPPRALRMVAT